jgi:hypothetical protein
MGDWEKIILQHYRRLSYGAEWVRVPKGGLFLLAWKGRQVEVVFADRKRSAGKAGPGAVKKEFMDLLGHLCRDPRWGRVFRGRDVIFKWMMFQEPTREECQVLEMSGVEPFEFSRFWEAGDAG